MKATRWIIAPDPCRTEKDLIEAVEAGFYKTQTEAADTLDGFDPARPHKAVRVEITLLGGRI